MPFHDGKNPCHQAISACASLLRRMQWCNLSAFVLSVIRHLMKSLGRQIFQASSYHVSFLIAAKNNFTISLKHLPGKTNEIADALSRKQFVRFFHFAPQVQRLLTPTPGILRESDLCMLNCKISCLKHLHRFLHRAGYLPQDFNTHSFRIGAATSAAWQRTRSNCWVGGKAKLTADTFALTTQPKWQLRHLLSHR